MASPRKPSAVWAQRADVVYVTFQLLDASDVKIDMTESSLTMSASSKGAEYAVDLTFHADIVPADCKQRISPHEISIILQKKDTSSGWWPRLLRDSAKVHWLKVDFNKWRDEDDSDDGKSVDTSGFGDMMNGMGGGMPGMGGMGGMPGMGGMGGMPGMGGMGMPGMGGMGGMPGMGGMGGMPGMGGFGGGDMPDFDDDSDDGGDDSDAEGMPDLEDKAADAGEAAEAPAAETS